MMSAQERKLRSYKKKASAGKASTRRHGPKKTKYPDAKHGRTKHRPGLVASHRRYTKSNLRDQEDQFIREMLELTENTDPRITDEIRSSRTSAMEDTYLQKQRNEFVRYRAAKPVLNYLERQHRAPGTDLKASAIGECAGDTSYSPLDVREKPVGKKMGPFSDEELRHLAINRSIPGRSTRALKRVSAKKLAKLLKIRDDWEGETDPTKKAKKEKKLFKQAAKVDSLFALHASAWVKVVKYRPSSWTEEHARMVADSLDENDVLAIKKLKKSKVTAYLTALEPRISSDIEPPKAVSIQDHLTAVSGGRAVVLMFPGKQKRIIFFGERSAHVSMYHFYDDGEMKENVIDASDDPKFDTEASRPLLAAREDLLDFLLMTDTREVESFSEAGVNANAAADDNFVVYVSIDKSGRRFVRLTGFAELNDRIYEKLGEADVTNMIRAAERLYQAAMELSKSLARYFLLL
jgi:hypothetical protein